MAADLTSLASPMRTKRVTLGNAGTATELQLPDWCRTVALYFQSSGGADEAGQYASDGTDAAAIGNDVQIVPSGQGAVVYLTEGRGRVESPKLYVTGSTNAGYVYLTVMGAS